MSAANSARNRKSASLEADPDPLHTLQARVLDLATMFKALARLSDSEMGTTTDFEITLVAKQGERMANELSDSIDQLRLDQKCSPEVAHHGEA
jgi:hypothetical protein